MLFLVLAANNTERLTFCMLNLWDGQRGPRDLGFSVLNPCAGCGFLCWGYCTLKGNYVDANCRGPLGGHDA